MTITDENQYIRAVERFEDPENPAHWRNDGQPLKRKFTLIMQPDDEFPVILDPPKRIPDRTEVEVLYPQQTYPTPSQRFQWSESMVYTVCTLSVAVDVSNIVVFPYLWMQYGGAAFLIPYFIMLVFTVLPCFYMECIIGQYTREGTVAAWKICPVFKGIGWCMLVITFFSACYNMAFMSWSVVIIGDAAASWYQPKGNLWSSCDQDWNTEHCRTARVIRTYKLPNTSGSYSGQEYFRGRVLEQRVDHGTLQWMLHGPVTYSRQHLINIAVFCTLVGLIVAAGVQHATTVSWFCCLSGVAGLIVLCYRAVVLPGSEDGMRHFFKPDFAKLLEIRTWEEATRFCFHSPGVGYGLQLTFSSYNRFGRNVLPTVIVTIVADVLLSIISATAVFSFIGFMALRFRQDVSDVVEIVPELLFEIMTEVLGDLPTSNFFVFVAFCSILVMGINHKINCMLNLVCGVIDEFKVFFRRNKRSRYLLILLMTVLLYGVSLAVMRKAGIFWMTLYEHRMGVIQMLVIFLQVVVIGWIYGIQALRDSVEAMTGYPPNILFRIAWKTTCPLGIFLVLVSRCVDLTRQIKWREMEILGYGNYLTAITISVPVLIVPSFALYYAFWKKPKYDVGNNKVVKRLLLISPEHEHQDIVEKGTGKRTKWSHYLSFGGAPMTVYYDEQDDTNFPLTEDCALPLEILEIVKREAQINPRIREEYLSSVAQLEDSDDSDDGDSLGNDNIYDDDDDDDEGDDDLIDDSSTDNSGDEDSSDVAPEIRELLAPRKMGGTGKGQEGQGAPQTKDVAKNNTSGTRIIGPANAPASVAESPKPGNPAGKQGVKLDAGGAQTTGKPAVALAAGPLSGQTPGPSGGQPTGRAAVGPQAGPSTGQPTGTLAVASQPGPSTGQPIGKPAPGQQPGPSTGRPAGTLAVASQPGPSTGQPVGKPAPGPQPGPSTGQPAGNLAVASQPGPSTVQPIGRAAVGPQAGPSAGQPTGNLAATSQPGPSTGQPIGRAAVGLQAGPSTGQPTGNLAATSQPGPPTGQTTGKPAVSPPAAGPFFGQPTGKPAVAPHSGPSSGQPNVKQAVGTEAASAGSPPPGKAATAVDPRSAGQATSQPVSSSQSPPGGLPIVTPGPSGQTNGKPAPPVQSGVGNTLDKPPVSFVPAAQATVKPTPSPMNLKPTPSPANVKAPENDDQPKSTPTNMKLAESSVQGKPGLESLKPAEQAKSAIDLSHLKVPVKEPRKGSLKDALQAELAKQVAITEANKQRRGSADPKQGLGLPKNPPDPKKQ